MIAERAKYPLYTHSQMCSLCEVAGRGVHFNPYARVGGQVGERSSSGVHLSSQQQDLQFCSEIFKLACNMRTLQEIKYGVVSTSALIRDLWTWDNLFMAGRLQKPVLVVANDSIFDDALTTNLDSALAAALLLLPAQFSSQVCAS